MTYQLAIFDMAGTTIDDRDGSTASSAKPPNAKAPATPTRLSSAT